jgi:predicted TIM-barrel fold metal-dependent hydrolase
MLIDFHYHLADTDSALNELLADMDRSGVDWSVLIGGPTGCYWEYKQCGFATNERAAKAVKTHSDRLLGNVYLDPRETAALDTLKRFLDQGFRAVKLFPPIGFEPNTEAFHPLYDEIERRGVPVLVHAGQTNIQILGNGPQSRRATDSRFAHPMNLDQLARLFPGIPLVYNAMGGQNFIPIDFARVLWGSDNCLPQAEHIARLSTYMRQIGAGGEQRRLIFGENARKLLKLG